MPSSILITGGTGLVGKALTRALLNRGYRVIVLSRGKVSRSTPAGLSYSQWDLRSGTIDQDVIGSVDHIIHLAGAGVAEKRWTAARKKEIRDSRVLSGELLVKALQTMPNKVKSLISASGIGWYGPDPGAGFTGFVESDPAYADFLGTTCVEWEASTQPLSAIGVRVVAMRTGIVLSREGGAYPEFMKPIRLGVEAILGSGKQIVSWIHIDDLVNIYIKAIEDDRMKGAYNAVAPQPVSNRELIKTMSNAKGGFHIPVKVPEFALKMLLGEMSIEVLKSTTVKPEKLLAMGYVFQFPDLSSAINELSGREK